MISQKQNDKSHPYQVTAHTTFINVIKYAYNVVSSKHKIICFILYIFVFGIFCKSKYAKFGIGRYVRILRHVVGNVWCF